MKKILLTIVLAALCSVGYSQTNTVSTNQIPVIPKLSLGTITNWAVDVHYTRAPQATVKNGGGANLWYNFNQNIGTGIGFEYLGGFDAFSGNVTFRLPTYPLSFLGGFFKTIRMTDFAITGLEAPISGSGIDRNGNIYIIGGGGANFDLYTTKKGWMLGAGYAYVHATGTGPFAGPRHEAFFDLHKAF